jgi:hypothetical protein
MPAAAAPTAPVVDTAADTADLHACQALAARHPAPTPRAELVWTAVVDIAPRESLGTSGRGERFIVPITGGHFWGGPGHEGLCGRVRPGGADRQCLRPDGVKELHALYEMETDSGTVLTIDNRVVVDDTVVPQRYAMSHIAVSAPEGPHAWLNRRLLVGTLQPLMPERQAVRIQAFVLMP